jgi:hypothetical protein
MLTLVEFAIFPTTQSRGAAHVAAASPTPTLARPAPNVSITPTNQPPSALHPPAYAVSLDTPLILSLPPVTLLRRLEEVYQNFKQL